MLSFICGKVVDCYENILILRSGDIGYELCVSDNTVKKLNVEDNIQLYCHLHIKEDGMQLYGFATREEKSMFLRLITVSGIGCKLAVTILSGMDINSLAIAIFNNDVKTLTSIKGLGKKTAERLVLELREKVEALSINGGKSVEGNNNCDSAVGLLIALGLSAQEAGKRVEIAHSLGAVTTEEIINMSLRID